MEFKSHCYNPQVLQSSCTLTIFYIMYVPTHQGFTLNQRSLFFWGLSVLRSLLLWIQSPLAGHLLSYFLCRHRTNPSKILLKIAMRLKPHSRSRVEKQSSFKKIKLSIFWGCGSHFNGYSLHGKSLNIQTWFKNTKSQKSQQVVSTLGCMGVGWGVNLVKDLQLVHQALSRMQFEGRIITLLN